MKRETRGRKKETKSARINMRGTTRLQYNPSRILVTDILCVSKLRSGLLTYSHSQQFINPVKHMFATYTAYGINILVSEAYTPNKPELKGSKTTEKRKARFIQSNAVV